MGRGRRESDAPASSAIHSLRPCTEYTAAAQPARRAGLCARREDGRPGGAAGGEGPEGEGDAGAGAAAHVLADGLLALQQVQVWAAGRCLR